VNFFLAVNLSKFLTSKFEKECWNALLQLSYSKEKFIKSFGKLFNKEIFPPILHRPFSFGAIFFGSVFHSSDSFLQSCCQLMLYLLRDGATSEN
jgi:hypothetical protein